MPVTRFDQIIRVLGSARVDYVLVGGLAARALGSPRATEDINIVYERSDANIQRLVDALRPYSPYLRGAPPGLPFSFDAPTVRQGLNFTLVLTIGWLDLLGEATGGGTYEQLVGQSLVLRVFDQDVRCVTLEALIRLKRAAGRAKDFEAIAELESLRLRGNDPE